jgi:PA14 domain
MKNAVKVLLACLLGGCAAPRLAPPPSPAPAAAAEPRTPGQHDWTWVQGAVFVPTNCVNEAQQWDEYDPQVNDRELHFASVYGINVVRVYLHYYIYLKKKAAFLASIEDFLQRADRYGIRTEFVFFDDCWNQPPKDILSADYHYPSPIAGVHNSRWLVCPGDQVRNHYEQHRAGLKAYVQDVVTAHAADPRVVFWEIYNEPSKTEATIRLLRDAMGWIKQTGTTRPVTATGGPFSGGPFSDFPSWHEYGGYALTGDAFSLCTECMNRQGQSVPGVVEHFKGRVGFIMWEFGIGRDNCRFAWSDGPSHPRKDEPTTPFHGIVYPDGHPWSLGDARALLGSDRYERTPFFRVTYFRDDSFRATAKVSVTPAIDLKLVDEPGAGSPDASAGVPRDHFSVQYDGEFRAPADGLSSISVLSDGWVDVQLDERPFLQKEVAEGAASRTLRLEAGALHRIRVRYSHATGDALLRVTCSGPAFTDRVLDPATHPAGL